jgi:GNAT superfamily N-acetyltransferase
VRHKGNQEIMAIGTYMGGDDARAEVAFVVREDFQGQGVASYLLGQLETIARANGYQGFFASMLPQNKGMLRVFEKRYPQAVFKTSSGETAVVMNFDGSTVQEP